MQDKLGLCVIGYSTRALCQACQRLGLRPISIDAFADQDCQMAASIALRADRWGTLHDPQAAESIVKSLENHGNPKILLGGGMENWPHLVQLLHQHFELLGPSQDQLITLRDPSFWCVAAREAGICFPATIEANEPPAIMAATETSVQWLTKPYAGAGGIQVARSLTPRSLTPSRPQQVTSATSYLQQWISGRVIGAHCILSDSGPELLGITEALTHRDWPGPSEFIYRGSWGLQPTLESEPLKAPILSLAKVIQARTGLRGWVQFDLVESPSGQLWLLEVNPRWAAGMELIVDSGRANPVAKHLAAFGYETPSSSRRDVLSVQPENQASASGEPCVAKAILYAPHAIVLRAELLAILHQLPDIADIPSSDALGQVVEQGHPLLTVKATLAPSVAKLLSPLDRKHKLLMLLQRRAEQITAKC